MTKPIPHWNPEQAGKAAGVTEKNTRPGIRITRPIDWTPGPSKRQLARAHRSLKRHLNDRELDRKLDAVLGPVEEE